MSMRKIDVDLIKETVAELCIKANTVLRPDILGTLRNCLKEESSRLARGILKAIIENAKIARHTGLAICQDTGLTVVFLEIGQDVRITGGALKKAINDGVKIGYRKGYLRKSVVDDPLTRKNTMTNTPCVVHTDIVMGERLKIVVSPKGFGSENKSSIRMLRPTDTLDDVKTFILDVVRQAGPDACPPLVLGVGIGGTFEKAALLSKKALLRPIGIRNPKRCLARFETELLKSINSLGIGPMGLGGRTTALGVNILDFGTHIAGLPVAVNVGCHATRSAERKI